MKARFRIVALATAIMLAQLTFALFFADPLRGIQTSFRDKIEFKYGSLNNWDSEWYRSIGMYGYRNTTPPIKGQFYFHQNNVAFLPGYPWLAKLVYWITPLDFSKALLVTSQLACVVFWIYLLLLTEELSLSPFAKTATVILIASFPGSFFLVAGYSESMLLAGSLGLIYFFVRSKGKQWLPSGLNGLVATFTHLRAIYVLCFPVIACFAWKNPKKYFKHASLTIGFSLLGGAIFASVLILQFGSTHIFFETRDVMWGRAPFSPLAVFHARIYRLHIPEISQKFGTWCPDMFQLGQWVGTWLTIALTAALLFEVCRWLRSKKNTLPQIELILVAAAFVFFYLINSTLQGNDVYINWPMMTSARYGLFPFILLVLAMGRKFKKPSVPAIIGLILLAGLCFTAQSKIIYAFTAGEWPG